MWVDSPYPGRGVGVADDDEEERDGEEEAFGDVAEEADGAPEGATVAGLVVVDGVQKAVNNDAPGEEGKDATSLETGVRTGGGGDVIFELGG